MHQAWELGSLIRSLIALCCLAGVVIIPIVVASGTRYMRCPRCTQRVYAPKSQRNVACPMCGSTILQNGQFAVQAPGRRPLP